VRFLKPHRSDLNSFGMWEEIQFTDSIVKNKVGRNNQINASEIQPLGKYPVIDQGQNFIAGYCDDETKLIKDELPFIIFGDHTRCFKYVDFPFILGADGTKVLKPNLELFDPKFYYFALLSLNIPNRGYNRHFTLLKEKKVPKPELDEQRRIAHVLSAVQTSIEQQARLIALTRELKAALMRQLFTTGLRGEKQKQTEIGQVSESWEVSRFDELCVLQRGFDITKKEQKPGNVPVVSSGGISSYHNIAKVNAPGVVIGRKGSLGTVHYLDVDFWPHDTTLWVKDFKGNDPLFTAYFLETLHLEKYNSGASNPTLNRNTVHADIIAFPKVDEQKEIGMILKQVDNKALYHGKRKALLEELFRTLLHHLMTGQIRTTGLDLSGLEEDETNGTPGL